ncbi:MAG: glycosyltransferase family 4 protein [Candidatus Omnitrophota bacterium]
MKILLLTTHLNVGGIGVYTVNLAKYLKQSGVEVIVASSGGKLEEDLLENKIEHIYMDIKTKFEFGFKIWKALPRLTRLVNSKNIDLIHSQTRTAQVLAFLSQKYTKVPFISTCHGFFKHKRLSRKIFPCWGEKVIAISDSVKKHLIGDFGLPEEKIIRVYTGIEVDRFLKVNSSKRDEILEHMGLKGDVDIIGAIGRLSPVKGFRYLIEAFKQITVNYKNARLLIVGEGPEKEFLHKKILGLGMEGRVIITSNKMPLESFLSIIDIFCLPSVNEGLGLSLMEAMAAAKACVASRVGGVSELISHEEEGILVPPEDAGALREGIERLLNDMELRRGLGENARGKARESFSIKDSVRKTIEVYQVCCHS